MRKKPLRNPGESLSEEIDRKFNEDAMPYLMGAAFFTGFIIYEWIRWEFKIGISPWTFTIGLSPVVMFCVYKFYQIAHQTRNLRTGLEGEKYVGQYLETLRPLGFRICHDIPPSGKGMANIDHLIVCPQGIFVVETKTRTKVNGRDNVVNVTDDGRLLFNGQEADRDAIAQVQALRSNVRELLKETTGRDFPVRGIITIPEWFVRGRCPIPGLWVLNPKGIRYFICNENDCLSEEDIALVCSRIADYIRSKHG
jgi:hypothetical protein